jgi:hypothetical protein
MRTRPREELQESNPEEADLAFITSILESFSNSRSTPGQHNHSCAEFLLEEVSPLDDASDTIKL